MTADESDLTTALRAGLADFELTDADQALVDGDACTLTVLAAGVADVDTNDPPDNLAANFTTTFTVADQCSPSAVTRIPAIQGSGSA